MGKNIFRSIGFILSLYFILYLAHDRILTVYRTATWERTQTKLVEQVPMCELAIHRKYRSSYIGPFDCEEAERMHSQSTAETSVIDVYIYRYFVDASQSVLVGPNLSGRPMKIGMNNEALVNFSEGEYKIARVATSSDLQFIGGCILFAVFVNVLWYLLSFAHEFDALAKARRDRIAIERAERREREEREVLEERAALKARMARDALD